MIRFLGCQEWNVSNSYAERTRRAIEISFEKAAAGTQAKPDDAVTIPQAVEVFLKDKRRPKHEGQWVKKFGRELGRFVKFCDQRDRFFLQEVILPDLTEYRTG